MSRYDLLGHSVSTPAERRKRLHLVGAISDLSRYAGKESTVTFTDKEAGTIVARKEVVEEVKKVNDQVAAAADAKANAKTAEDLQKAQAQAQTAQANAEALAKKATAPSAKDIIDDVKAAANLVALAANADQMRAAQERSRAASAKVDAELRKKITLILGLALAGGFVVGGAIGIASWAAHRGLGFLIGGLLGAPVLGGGVYAVWAASQKKKIA